jgi:hypothetical protein
MAKTYLVPEYQRRRYLVHHVVEARSRGEAHYKALEGNAALEAEQLLSTTHVPIELNDIVELQQTPERG